MPASNAERFLSDGTDDRALALKMFMGLTLSVFYNKTKFYDRSQNVIQHKSVTSGKSWQFIQIADGVDPAYHTPGTEMLGMDYAFDEGTITIDDPLVHHVDIPEDQLRMAHFDAMAPMVRQNARKIAEDVDKKMAIVGVLAARTAAKTNTVSGTTLTIHNGGNIIERVGGTGEKAAWPATATGAQNFRDDAAQLAQLMDEDNVPEDNRFLYIKPYIRRVLGKDTTIFNRDFNPTTDNVLNKRIVGELEGFNLIITNHLPNTNVTANSFGGKVPSKYQGDFTFDGATAQPVALALCGAIEGNAGIGMVDAGGIVFSAHFDLRRRTWFLYAGLAMGLGVLSPWCAGEIRVDNS